MVMERQNGVKLNLIIDTDMNTKEKTTDEYTLLVWKRCVCVCKDRTEPLPHVNNTEEYHYRNKHAQTHPHSLSTHIQYITAVLNIRDIHKVRVCVQSSLVRGPLLWMFLMIAWTTSEVVPCPPMSAVCNWVSFMVVRTAFLIIVA